MIGKVFVDTHVLAHALDAGEPRKQHRAREILAHARSGSHAVSPQILQEFWNVLTRKLARPISLDGAEAAVRAVARLTVVPADVDIVISAIGFHRRHRIAWWDGLVIQAALVGGCTRLLSEDLQDGFRVGPLTVENPFGDLG